MALDPDDEALQDAEREATLRAMADEEIVWLDTIRRLADEAAEADIERQLAHVERETPLPDE